MVRYYGLEIARGCRFIGSFCAIIDFCGRSMRHSVPAAIEACLQECAAAAKRVFAGMEPDRTIAGLLLHAQGREPLLRRKNSLGRFERYVGDEPAAEAAGEKARSPEPWPRPGDSHDGAARPRAMPMTVPDPGASGRASEPPPTRTVNAGRARPTTFSLLARWDRWASSRSRLRYLPPRLARHLTDVGDMLDIGSGNGQIAQRLLQSDPTLSITAVDVMVQPDPCIAVSQYDGIRLPFADNTFDAVILIDVLHHDRQPERLLREALRVARRRVLIKDHYWITRWDRMLLSIADYLGNRAYGIELPYNFLKIEGWLELFDRAGARVARVEKFRYSVLDRVKQIIFVLEPPTSATGATVDRAGRPDASGIATVKTSS